MRRCRKYLIFGLRFAGSEIERTGLHSLRISSRSLRSCWRRSLSRTASMRLWPAGLLLRPRPSPMPGAPRCKLPFRRPVVVLIFGAGAPCCRRFATLTFRCPSAAVAAGEPSQIEKGRLRCQSPSAPSDGAAPSASSGGAGNAAAPCESSAGAGSESGAAASGGAPNVAAATAEVATEEAAGAEIRTEEAEAESGAEIGTGGAAAGAAGEGTPWCSRDRRADVPPRCWVAMNSRSLQAKTTSTCGRH
mmetsp:Transcript_148595/g.477074  ORF Transcript_148595/g.477074 Transcript_148595/m.477074 type:complete len:247 (-) Transcript_148595:3-743(-)